MYYSEAWLEPFTLCKETTQKLVSNLSIKIVISTIKKMQINKRIYSVPTYIMRRERAGELVSKPITTHPYKLAG